MTGLDRALEWAAFAGAPGSALRLLPADPAALPPRTRWLAGVCLGALGRYAAAARLLLPAGGGPAGSGPDGTAPGSAVGSLLASTRASHLRQLGRHGEAEECDQAALRAAPAGAAGPDAPAARADALVGLVADAVGAGDLGLARRRLTAARAGAAGRGWRAEVRLRWVAAEVALLAGTPGAAVEAGTEALGRARAAGSARHVTKSLLVLGVARQAAGERREAVRTLRLAARSADRLGTLPLVWPARLVLARLLVEHSPGLVEHERQAGSSAICSIATGLPAAEAASLLAQRDLQFLVGSENRYCREVP